MDAKKFMDSLTLLFKYLFHPYFLPEDFIGYNIKKIEHKNDAFTVTLDYIEKNYKSDMTFTVKNGVILDINNSDVLRDDPSMKLDPVYKAVVEEIYSQ